METLMQDPKELRRIVVVSTPSEERVYIDGKLVATGQTLQAETVANLAEDHNIPYGKFFVVVVGLTSEYDLGDELSLEDYNLFGLTP